jgi:hypothetical protein
MKKKMKILKTLTIILFSFIFSCVHAQEGLYLEESVQKQEWDTLSLYGGKITMNYPNYYESSIANNVLRLITQQEDQQDLFRENITITSRNRNGVTINQFIEATYKKAHDYFLAENTNHSLFSRDSIIGVNFSYEVKQGVYECLIKQCVLFERKNITIITFVGEKKRLNRYLDDVEKAFNSIRLTGVESEWKEYKREDFSIYYPSFMKKLDNDEEVVKKFLSQTKDELKADPDLFFIDTHFISYICRGESFLKNLEKDKKELSSDEWQTKEKIINGRKLTFITRADNASMIFHTFHVKEKIYVLFFIGKDVEHCNEIIEKIVESLKTSD